MIWLFTTDNPRRELECPLFNMNRCWAEMETEENNKSMNEMARFSIRKYSIKKLNAKIRKAKPVKCFEFYTGRGLMKRHICPSLTGKPDSAA